MEVPMSDFLSEFEKLTPEEQEQLVQKSIAMQARQRQSQIARRDDPAVKAKQKEAMKKQAERRKAINSLAAKLGYEVRTVDGEVCILKDGEDVTADII